MVGLFGGMPPQAPQGFAGSMFSPMRPTLPPMPYGMPGGLSGGISPMPRPDPIRRWDLGTGMGQRRGFDEGNMQQAFYGISPFEQFKRGLIPGLGRGWERPGWLNSWQAPWSGMQQAPKSAPAPGLTQLPPGPVQGAGGPAGGLVRTGPQTFTTGKGEETTAGDLIRKYGSIAQALERVPGGR